MKYYVTVQSNATVRFSREIEAANVEAAKTKLVEYMYAIDCGSVEQSGEILTRPFTDATFEVTEAPKLEHDFTMADIEVEEVTPTTPADKEAAVVKFSGEEH